MAENVPNFPLFCELCLVKFQSNGNAELHFNGPQHRNKVMLAFHRKPQLQDLIWCNICCCELNTQKALELHNQSPKHRKKEEAYTEIMELKKQYIDKISSAQETPSLITSNLEEKSQI